MPLPVENVSELQKESSVARSPVAKAVLLVKESSNAVAAPAVKAAEGVVNPSKLGSTSRIDREETLNSAALQSAMQMDAGLGFPVSEDANLGAEDTLELPRASGSNWSSSTDAHGVFICRCAFLLSVTPDPRLTNC